MKYLSFLFVFICFAFFSPPIIGGTLGDTVTVTTTVPVDHYEVRVKEAIGFSIISVSNPADDPDSDGDIVVSSGATGMLGTIGMDKFLTGQPLGAYVIEAASVDANGQMSGWTTQNFTYSPPEAPGVSVGLMWMPDVGVPQEYARLEQVT